MSQSSTGIQLIGRAVSHGRIDDLRSLAATYKALLDQDFLNCLLRMAADCNHVSIMSYLCELGADIHAPKDDENPEGCIQDAASFGAIDALKWLIDRGARINFEVNGGVRCFPLTGATFRGHLEAVKLLVANGADINATWNGKNALSIAVSYGRREVEAFLRANGAKLPEGFGDDRLQSPDWIEHVRSHLGEPKSLSLRQIVPSDPAISVHVVEMQGGKALVTSGMSARPMAAPPGWEELRFAELVMYLPENWPLDQDSLADSDSSWPMQWMLKIASHPHATVTWLGGKSVVFANDDPPLPLASNTKLSCLLAMTEDSDFGCWFRPDGTSVWFYTVFPIYSKERDFEREKGTVALLERFQTQGISRVVDIARPCVVE